MSLQAPGRDDDRPLGSVVRSISPTFAAGLERIHTAIEEDGALPAPFKALAGAAAAANRSRTQLMLGELTRARGLGVTAPEALAGALALLLARGEEPFAAFAGAVHRLYDAEVDPNVVACAAATSPHDALAYFGEHFGGEVPDRQRVFAALVPVAFEGYHLMHRAVLKESALAPRSVELLLCAINASDYQAAFLEIHVAGARALGAGEEEIAEAVVCAVPAAGIAVWPGAAEAIVRTRP